MGTVIEITLRNRNNQLVKRVWNGDEFHRRSKVPQDYQFSWARARWVYESSAGWMLRTAGLQHWRPIMVRLVDVETGTARLVLGDMPYEGKAND